MDRNRIAIKSSMIGLISQVLVFLASFVVRTFFIKYLSTEILGIDGVLRNCVSMLSMADLGVGSAMVYRLYKPINTRDINALGQLLSLYRVIYRYIILTIIGISFIVGIFLPKIITGIENVSWSEIYLSYFLQVVGIVTSYILAYKRCLISASQKNYVIVFVDAVCNVIACALKMIILVSYRSYQLYLVIAITQYALSNVILSIFSYRLNPDINYECKWKNEQKTQVLQDTRHLIAGKIAGYIYGSTDNIIISAFLSTYQVGLISNYKYIFAIIATFINGMVSSIGAIIGNRLNDSIKIEEAYSLLRKYSFVRFVIADILIIPAIALCQQFISIWAGKDYLLDRSIIAVIAMDLYIGCVYGPLGEYMGGLGYFKYDKIVSICGAVVNMVSSLLGVRFLGYIGVFLGTVLSQMVMWIGKTSIIFGVYFGRNKKYLFDYIKKEVLYVFVSVLLVFIGHKIVDWISIDGYIGFMIKGMLLEIMIALGIVIIFWKDDSFRFMKHIIVDYIRNRR